MHPKAKMAAGVVLAVVGVAWYLPPAVGGPFNVFWGITMLTNWQALLTAFQASFGIVIGLAGLFIAWLEYDEWRLQRELEDDAFGERVEDRLESGQDHQFDDLVQEHTVDEVKQRVREDDLDPDAVLAAERRHKDRTTLTDWLEDRA